MATREPCPRCGGPIEGRFYGPCSACRQTLRDAAIRWGEVRAKLAELRLAAVPVPPNARIGIRAITRPAPDSQGGESRG